jgi:hypothetical protein
MNDNEKVCAEIPAVGLGIGNVKLEERDFLEFRALNLEAENVALKMALMRNRFAEIQSIQQQIMAKIAAFRGHVNEHYGVTLFTTHRLADDGTLIILKADGNVPPGEIVV